jgi:hypothetical protein
MNKRLADPILKNSSPDRLHYSTGELLGADDFRAEQSYHRRQLAKTLLHFHGSGTVAGLGVIARHQPGPNGAPDEVHLEVRPGLALDRAGRLIEIPREACLRLRRWFEFIARQLPDSTGADASDLRAAFRNGVVVADIFLAFHPCDRGYTPAFASGPFDALDASQPSRIRDAYELSLVLRFEADMDLPRAFDPWAAILGGTPAERLASAQLASLNAWDTLALPPTDDAADFHENPAGVDPTAVLLARLRIPAGPPPDAASAPLPNWSAAAWPSENANLDNTVRNFLLPPAALRRVAGI